MPQPDSRDLHVDVLLTELSIAYRNTAYIADEQFPIVAVRKRSDIIPQYDQSHWFRNAAELRAPATRSRGGGFTVDNTKTYFAHRFSYRFEISDDVRDNADDPYDLDRDGAEFVADKMLLRREIDFATDFFTTGVWGTDKVGATDFTVWSDYGASSPLTDLEGFKDDMESKIAREPNQFTLGKQVWVKLKWHPDLIDTIKHTQRAQMTLEIFGGLIEIPRLFVGRAIQVTSAEGVVEASAVYARVWGKHGLLLYRPERPSLLTPAAGYTFVWQRVPNALQYVKAMRDEEREVDIVEGNSYFDQAAVATKAGVFLSGAVG